MLFQMRNIGIMNAKTNYELWKNGNLNSVYCSKVQKKCKDFIFWFYYDFNGNSF